jgi:glycerol-3-phosphate acyltransferase PlsY
VTAAWCVLLGFACGALPFSFWLSRRFAGADVRRLGDGTPGAANAWRAGGWRVGLAALLLDYAKGVLPVAWAHFVVGLTGVPLVLAALAPLVGHIFSPFLGFRGGKGLTVTFGLWSGLTLAAGPLVLGLLMTLFYFTLNADAWAVLASLGGLLLYLVFLSPDPTLLAVGLGNLALLAWTHRRELRRRPGFHPRFSGQQRA